jgi:hypothetical protein
MVQPDKATDDSIIRRMRFACWITEAADTEDLGVGRGQARFHSSSTVVETCYLLIYIKSAIWLTPGRSITVHIYTETIH